MKSDKKCPQKMQWISKARRSKNQKHYSNFVMTKSDIEFWIQDLQAKNDRQNNCPDIEDQFKWSWSNFASFIVMESQLQKFGYHWIIFKKEIKSQIRPFLWIYGACSSDNSVDLSAMSIHPPIGGKLKVRSNRPPITEISISLLNFHFSWTTCETF